MKMLLNSTILISAAILGSCQNKREDLVFEKFQEQMKPVQLRIDSLLKDSTGQVSTIYFSDSIVTGAFNLSSIRQSYLETNNEEALIHETKQMVNAIKP